MKLIISNRTGKKFGFADAENEPMMDHPGTTPDYCNGVPKLEYRIHSHIGELSNWLTASEAYSRTLEYFWTGDRQFT